jgi:hypothetical protein
MKLCHDGGFCTILSSLPGDVNGDGIANVKDILILLDHLNDPEGILLPHQCDLNHSGQCEPQDILRLIDILNGANEFFDWLGYTLPGICLE